MNKYVEHNFLAAFNGDVIKDINEINKKIKEELENEEGVDREKLLQLKMQKLYRGMEMNSGIINKWGRRPY